MDEGPGFSIGETGEPTNTASSGAIGHSAGQASWAEKRLGPALPRSVRIVRATLDQLLQMTLVLNRHKHGLGMPHSCAKIVEESSLL